MKLTHLGSGIVLVRDLVQISHDDNNEINRIFESTTPQGYSIVDGKTISDGGYEFDEISKSKSPTRYTNISEFSITRKLRESIYSAVVEYCKVFLPNLRPLDQPLHVQRRHLRYRHNFIQNIFIIPNLITTHHHPLFTLSLTET